MLTLEV